MFDILCAQAWCVGIVFKSLAPLDNNPRTLLPQPDVSDHILENDTDSKILALLVGLLY